MDIGQDGSGKILRDRVVDISSDSAFDGDARAVAHLYSVATTACINSNTDSGRPHEVLALAEKLLAKESFHRRESWFC